MTKTTQQYKDEVLYLVGHEYEVLGEYINFDIKVLTKHNSSNCNNFEWEVRPRDFIKGVRCPRCQHRSYRKTTEEFKEEVFKQSGNEYTVLGEYTHKDTKLLMRHNCSKCDNFEWEIAPHNFLDNAGRKGRGCPYCSKSLNEKKISELLKQFNIYNIQHYTYEGLIGEGGDLLSYDFYLPNENLLIEYQGKQHTEFVKMMHGTQERFERQKEHDRRKEQYTIDNNINFLAIHYWDDKNIEKILRKELHITNKDKLIHIDSNLNVQI